MTNSPPAKVKNVDYQVLACGIDSLYLAINVYWNGREFFEYLTKLKELAREADDEEPGIMKAVDDVGEWKFRMAPFGIKGYEWILAGCDFKLLMGNWLSPQSRPSVLVEVSSAVLWRLGAEGAIAVLNALLEGSGARGSVTKVSRVDLCIDVLVPEDEWNIGLAEKIVCRADHDAIFRFKRKVSGLSIGKGKMMARLYDKQLEIAQKSKKFWMYDVYGLAEVPDGYKIIRTEFQLRRETLKQLKVNLIEDLFDLENNVWAYCSRKWLQYKTRPGKHHTQRKTLPFWEVVQNGYKGAQNATPAVREKIFKGKSDQLVKQTFGLLTSLMASEAEEYKLDGDYNAKMIDSFEAVWKGMDLGDKLNQEFSVRVTRKRAKYHQVYAEATNQKKKNREE